MSKPRYKWWGYIKWVIRDYPRLKREYENLHEQSVTAKYSGMPTGGGSYRGTEETALLELKHPEQKDYEAVKKTIEITKLMATGKERIKLIELAYWNRWQKLTLAGIAKKLNISETTAQRYNKEFIYLVAWKHGRITEEEYLERTKNTCHVAEKYGLIGGMKHDSL